MSLKNPSKWDAFLFYSKQRIRLCKVFYEILFQWIVVKEPLKIGKKQIEAFRSLKDRSGQNLGEK